MRWVGLGELLPAVLLEFGPLLAAFGPQLNLGCELIGFFKMWGEVEVVGQHIGRVVEPGNMPIGVEVVLRFQGFELDDDVVPDLFVVGFLFDLGLVGAVLKVGGTRRRVCRLTFGGSRGRLRCGERWGLCPRGGDSEVRDALTLRPVDRVSDPSALAQDSLSGSSSGARQISVRTAMRVRPLLVISRICCWIVDWSGEWLVDSGERVGGDCSAVGAGPNVL